MKIPMNLTRFLKNLLAYFLGLIVGMLLYGIFTIIEVQNSKEEAQEVTILNLLKQPEIFQDEVLEYIYELRIDHPQIVFAQAIKESGNFTSTVFQENHNMFGMKVPERRITTCIGINRGYAVYANWKASIIDYALYQEAYFRNLTEEEYLRKLQRIYAEDSLYIKDLQRSLYSIY